MDKSSKIYVAGGTGLVGSALLKALQSQGYTNLVLRTRKELELTDQQAVSEFFAKEKPEYVFLAAAKVGGIMTNIQKPVEFLYENLQIQNNVMTAAHRHGVKKLLFFSSVCVYPRACRQPMKEAYLLTGRFEPTNEAYALAKMAGMKLCQAYNQEYGTAFFGVIPASLYGPCDSFDLEEAHVLPALIRKFHEARLKAQKNVLLWGSGTPLREFLYVDDLAEASIFLMQNLEVKKDSKLDEIFLNVGTGQGTTIKELANLVKETIGFEGEITWDKSKPDGMPKKVSDINRIRKLGWSPQTDLSSGLKKTYEWYLESQI